MKNPITGNNLKQVYEPDTWNFRGETFSYIRTCWEDEETKERFTTTESDTAGYRQVTNQFCEKHGVPYTDEIIALRQRYGISAAKMALLLGLGTNQYRLYEHGEVPSISNARLISNATNPKVMLDNVERTKHLLKPNDYDKIKQKLQSIIDNEPKYKFALYDTNRIFATRRSKENGYAPISLKRLEALLVTIIAQCGEVWQTKMNKLLFYVDFLSYRERGMAISGLTYRAIDYGPVAERYQRAFSEFDSIQQQPRSIGNHEGDILTTNATANNDMFSPDERTIINQVCNKFKHITASNISDLSHCENAWKKHVSRKERIPYEEAFSLSAL